jgi:hypothetical protein
LLHLIHPLQQQGGDTIRPRGYIDQAAEFGQLLGQREIPFS